MGVSFGNHDRRMPQKVFYDVQRYTSHNQPRSERMSQIVHPEIVDPSS
ncbi:hypothetical protein LMG29542_02063 [Paraburkholderia humisilvae]|uniref:Uncharacterized protein n=1 Tax=Paraburkholderia humisilvae TaxID=627669 RepID=A0A6J5DJB9_9BURK|nr:hypothetical protein LMG29542_02063 [Paraburkholderia humisilvae]